MSDKIDNNEFEDFDGNLMEDDSFSEMMEENFDNETSFDGDFDEDTPEEDYDSFDEVDYSKPVKGNSINWFNIGIIGAVVIGIGVITYSYLPNIMGGQPKPQQKMAEQNRLEQTVEAKEEVSFFDNPDLLNDGDALIDNLKTQNDMDLFNTIDTAPEISEDEMNDLFAAIPTTEANIPTPPEDVEIQVVEPLPMPSDINPITIDGVEQIEEIIIDKAPINNVEIDNINTRIDSMNEKIESFMTRLDEKLTNMPAPTQQVSSIDNSEQLNQLQQTLSRLENRIDAMEAKPKIVVAPSPTPIVTVTEESKPKVVIEEKAPDVLLPTPEPAKTVKAAPKKRREPAYVPPKMTYELRGASNGQAVIAQKGTQNLQTVTIGTIVRGLGNIKSIAIENGQWVVRGTSGTVRQ